MTIEFQITEGVIHIRLIGSFDFSRQDQFEAAIEQALADKSATEVRVDLERTTFLDSSIIRGLLKLRQFALAEGRSLSLWNCNDKIRSIFSVGGFDQIFLIR